MTFEASDVLNSAKRNVSEYVKAEALKHCIDKRWSTLTCNRPLSNVLGLPVLSVSPDSGAGFATMLSSSTLYPREKACENSATLNLFDLYLQITRVLVLLDQTISYLWF